MAEIPNLFELAGNGLPVDHGQLGPCVGDDENSTETATVIAELGPCVGDDFDDGEEVPAN